MTQEQTELLKEGVSKILEGYIGEENSPYTRNLIYHKITDYLFTATDELVDVVITSSWDELPRYKKIWLYLFDKERVNKLKNSLDIYISTYKVPPLINIEAKFTI